MDKLEPPPDRNGIEFEPIDVITGQLWMLAIMTGIALIATTIALLLLG